MQIYLGYLIDIEFWNENKNNFQILKQLENLESEKKCLTKKNTWRIV